MDRLRGQPNVGDGRRGLLSIRETVIGFVGGAPPFDCAQGRLLSPAFGDRVGGCNPRRGLCPLRRRSGVVYATRLDSNEKRTQQSPAFSTGTGRITSPANIEMAPVQKRCAETFACITRTSHIPGNRLHTSWAT